LRQSQAPLLKRALRTARENTGRIRLQQDHERALAGEMAVRRGLRSDLLCLGEIAFRTGNPLIYQIKGKRRRALLNPSP
jgi:phosphopantetheinyl transferase